MLIECSSVINNRYFSMEIKRRRDDDNVYIRQMILSSGEEYEFELNKNESADLIDSILRIMNTEW